MRTLPARALCIAQRWGLNAAATAFGDGWWRCSRTLPRRRARRADILPTEEMMASGVVSSLDD